MKDTPIFHVEPAKPQEPLPAYRRLELPSLLVAELECVKAFSGMSPAAQIRFWLKSYTPALKEMAEGLEKITWCPKGPKREVEVDLTDYQSGLLDLAALAHRCQEADVVYTLCRMGMETIPKRFWAKACN